jgi:transcriptional regulator with XRE-family HTH domain
MDVQQLARALREHRLAHGWSLAELSRASGVSISYISNLENAGHPRPGAGKLESLARALGFGSWQELQRSAPAAIHKGEPLPPAIAAHTEDGEQPTVEELRELHKRLGGILDRLERERNERLGGEGQP